MKKLIDQSGRMSYSVLFHFTGEEKVSGLSLTTGIIIVLIAFLAEYLDSSLGMGYGTILTPILLIIGFSAMQIIPAILVSELFTGLIAAFFHNKLGNVDFKPKSTNIFIISKKIRDYGVITAFQKGTPLHLKVALLLAACSVLGSVTSVKAAISISDFVLNLYIGVLVSVVGIALLITRNMHFRFSWKKIIFLGTVAAFNKGISGGGYGPVVTSGQLLSGLDVKNTIGITSFAEGITCMCGLITYFLLKKDIDWILAPYLTAGAILSAPLAAYSVRKINTKKLRLFVTVLTIILGGFALKKALIT